jgi:hypothetical protein
MTELELLLSSLAVKRTVLLLRMLMAPGSSLIPETSSNDYCFHSFPQSAQGSSPIVHKTGP